MATADSIWFFDKPGPDTFTGGPGHDVLVLDEKAHFFTVLFGSDHAFVINRLNPAEPTSMSAIEEIDFLDRRIEISWMFAAQRATTSQIEDLATLYAVHFDRAPDAYGFGYWASRLAEGMSLQAVARTFFAQTADAHPLTMTAAEFVTHAYRTALDREPDSAGQSYWINDLEAGGQARETFLLALINGARAPTGSPADAEHLANKAAAGVYFARDKGLGNADWADWPSQVLAGVTSDPATVEQAKAMADHFAVLAADPQAEQLLLPIVGVVAPEAG